MHVNGKYKQRSKRYYHINMISRGGRGAWELVGQTEARQVGGQPRQAEYISGSNSAGSRNIYKTK